MIAVSLLLVYLPRHLYLGCFIKKVNNKKEKH